MNCVLDSSQTAACLRPCEGRKRNGGQLVPFQPPGMPKVAESLDDPVYGFVAILLVHALAYFLPSLKLVFDGNLTLFAITLAGEAFHDLVLFALCSSLQTEGPWPRYQRGSAGVASGIWGAV